MGHVRLGILAAALVVASCSSDDAKEPDVAEDAADEAAPDDIAAPGVDVAAPTVSGPVEGGQYGVPFNPLPSRLAEQYDYLEEEFFLEGTATSYRADGTWGSDGVWAAVTAETAPYKTRIVVRRPSDPEAFNGSVLVEWLNVTAGMDSDPDFGLAHDELLREGWAYVAVSAQKVGIEGGSGLRIDIPGFDVRALKEWDPERYGSLEHPGDAFSYDIFSQVAQALRRPGTIDVLHGLAPTTLIAAGESQSAMRMATYVNAVHPLAKIYDGFLIHSRGSSGAGVGDDPANSPMPDVGHIRTDLDQPVLQFVTETDLFGLGFVVARQEDSDSVRTWEVAGTAHADQSTLDYGVESGHEWNPGVSLDFSGVCGRLNDGPQGAVLRRAVRALREWVVSGSVPPSAPLLSVEDGRVSRDARGNAVGGIRTPATDAPVAVLTGEATEGSNVFCSLFGQTVAFDAATLASLYPTHESYVAAVRHAASAAVEAGFLLEEDAQSFVEEASGAAVPG